MEVTGPGFSHSFITLPGRVGAGIENRQPAVGRGDSQLAAVIGKLETVDCGSERKSGPLRLRLQIPDNQVVAVGSRQEIIIAADSYPFRRCRQCDFFLQFVFPGIVKKHLVVRTGDSECLRVGSVTNGLR